MVRSSTQQLALRRQLLGRRALREPAASAPGSRSGSHADLSTRPFAAAADVGAAAELSDRCAALELELGKLEQLLASTSILLFSGLILSGLCASKKYRVLVVRALYSYRYCIYE